LPSIAYPPIIGSFALIKAGKSIAAPSLSTSHLVGTNK
jgi:hypothetical protein